MRLNTNDFDPCSQKHSLQEFQKKCAQLLGSSESDIPNLIRWASAINGLYEKARSGAYGNNRNSSGLPGPRDARGILPASMERDTSRLRPRIFEPDIPEEVTGEELEKTLRAAHRISGDVTTWPVMADCERGLGNPLKALAMAGSPEVKRLEKSEEIEMRIVATGARRDLGEFDAAVIRLTCKELNNESQDWSLRLRYAYADALFVAGRKDEARQWVAKCVEIDTDEFTDAAERETRANSPKSTAACLNLCNIVDTPCTIVDTRTLRE